MPDDAQDATEYALASVRREGLGSITTGLTGVVCSSHAQFLDWCRENGRDPREPFLREILRVEHARGCLFDDVVVVGGLRYLAIMARSRLRRPDESPVWPGAMNALRAASEFETAMARLQASVPPEQFDREALIRMARTIANYERTIGLPYCVDCGTSGFALDDPANREPEPPEDAGGYVFWDGAVPSESMRRENNDEGEIW